MLTKVFLGIPLIQDLMPSLDRARFGNNRVDDAFYAGQLHKPLDTSAALALNEFIQGELKDAYRS